MTAAVASTTAVGIAPQWLHPRLAVVPGLDAEARDELVAQLSPGLVLRGDDIAAMTSRADAEDEVAAARRAAGLDRVSPEKADALEAVHQAVVDAEARCERRFATSASRRRLADALTVERSLLDELGFHSWSAYLLETRLLSSDRAAWSRLSRAEAALQAVERDAGPPHPDLSVALDRTVARLARRRGPRRRLVVDDGDGRLVVGALLRVAERLECTADRVPVVLFSDDRDLAAWATALGSCRSAVCQCQVPAAPPAEPLPGPTLAEGKRPPCGEPAQAESASCRRCGQFDWLLDCRRCQRRACGACIVTVGGRWRRLCLECALHAGGIRVWSRRALARR